MSARLGLHPILEVLTDPRLIPQVVIRMEAAFQSGPGCTILGVADFLNSQWL